MLLLALFLLLSPDISINAAQESLQLFANVVVPSLFPFIVCSQLLLRMGIGRALGFLFTPLARLLGCPKELGGAFLTSLLAGYPSGALSVSTLYRRGMLRQNLNTAVTLCSTAGPMFIVGMIGSSLLGSLQAGYIILISHYVGIILSATTINLLKKSKSSHMRQTVSPPLSRPVTHKTESLDEIITRSCLVMLKIGGFIVIFRVLGDVIFSAPFIRELFSLSGNTTSPAYIQTLLRGVIEMADGCASAASFPFVPACIMMCFIVSFGGFCIYFQSLSMLDGVPIQRGLFLLSKLFHGLFSSIICAILLYTLPIATTASALYSQFLMPSIDLSPAIKLTSYILTGSILMLLLVRQCPRIWVRFCRTISRLR